MKILHFPIAAFATVCFSVSAPAQSQPDKHVETNYDSLSSQIDIAKILRTLDLSADQIAQWRKLSERVGDAQRKFHRFRERDDVRGALRKVRDAILTGATNDAAWSAFDPFDDEYTALEKAVAEATTKATQSAFALLSPAQQLRLALIQFQSPADIIEQLATTRGSEPTAWREWRDSNAQTLATQIAHTNDPAAVDAATKTFAQFFDRLRNMNTDDFFAKRDVLARELRAMIAEAVGQTLNEERRAFTISILESWLTTDGFSETLQRLAALTK